MDIKRLASAVTIVLSAALLFVIQPMIAKTLLPRFGGSAGVWITSMMFFQMVLLLGYLYSYWITRYPGPRVRTAVHLGLLAVSLWALPLRLAVEGSSFHPVVSILLVLASTVGLPFLLLSTTSSLVQSWYAASGRARLPYGFFALSNIACVLALLAYPFAIEPSMTTTTQLTWWSGGYSILVLLLAASTIHNRGWTYEEPAIFRPQPGGLKPTPPSVGRASARQPGDSQTAKRNLASPSYEDKGDVETARGASSSRPFLWIALTACASTLWLAVANYLSQEVAAIPLLWVLPLTLYLLSFVVCFGWPGWYRPALFRWLLPVTWLAIGSRTGLTSTAGNPEIDIPIMLAALFVLCLFCHGELARTRPAARQDLAFFYLMTATGGALGGIFVGLAAPAVFSSYLELPIGVVASVFLALALIYGLTSRGRLLRLGVVAVAAFVVAANIRGDATSVVRERNFYGTLQIRDRGEGANATRTIYNGRTAHGVEFLSPERWRAPTAYYGTESGVGLLLHALEAPNRRVAMVGLGAGTLASYGRSGDFFRFYEINPAVIEAAQADFHFLAGSAATIDVVAGDGRLRLAGEPPHSFDLIVLDAFSDDAIPVHLLTREAFQLYFTQLRGSGSLAIHVSNRYLDLNPVVETLAGAFHKRVLRIHSPADPEQGVFMADWAIVSDSNETIEKLRPFADPGPGKSGPLWTDDYSNLLQVWR
jgi:hypothetical protein